MRALFTFGSLLVALVIVVVAVKHQLQAQRQFLPGANGPGAAGASAPFGASSQSVGQYQRELDRALQAGMAGRASAAESADPAEGSR
jgi:hypothetical protein